MTDGEQAETYEQRVQAIRQANQPILEGFEHWLRRSGCKCDYLMTAKFDKYLASYHHGLLFPEALERALQAGLRTLPLRKLSVMGVI